MSSAPRVESLRDIRLFAGLDDRSLSHIAELATEFEVPAGHILIEKDQPGSGMFVIERGRVTLELPHGNREFGPGDFVGETALLTYVPRTARVKALTEVSGLAIGRHDFHALLDEHPRIAVEMLKTLAARLAAMH